MAQRAAGAAGRRRLRLSRSIALTTPAATSAAWSCPGPGGPWRPSPRTCRRRVRNPVRRSTTPTPVYPRGRSAVRARSRAEPNFVALYTALRGLGALPGQGGDEDEVPLAALTHRRDERASHAHRRLEVHAQRARQLVGRRSSRACRWPGARRWPRGSPPRPASAASRSAAPSEREVGDDDAVAAARAASSRQLGQLVGLARAQHERRAASRRGPSRSPARGRRLHP